MGSSIFTSVILVGCIIIACIPFSFILAAACYPLYALLRKIFYVPFVRNKLVKKAIKNGHVITARKAKPEETRLHFYSEEAGKDTSVYLFDVNGRRCMRIFSSWSPNQLPDLITLYYQKNPQKAELSHEFGLRENPTWFLQYLVLVAICMVILCFVVMTFIQVKMQNFL